jgi:hypothetical protein
MELISCVFVTKYNHALLYIVCVKFMRESQLRIPNGLITQN